MAGFNDVLKAIGYGAGALTGGPSQIKAIAGAAAAKGKIDTYLHQFGKSVGSVLGADVFNKIGAGATITAEKETNAFVNAKILSPQFKATMPWLVAASLFFVVYFFYRGKS